jgi:hypothetical protein
LDSLVGQATDYGLDSRVSIHEKGKRFFSFLHNGSRGLFSQELRQLGHEADRSPPSSAEVKKDGAIPSLSYTLSWLDV